ncbi:efflux RND transporter periplasmic adaptor subunit [Pelagibius sp. Alg239-R121]|uniref:efflux RND transporter periplasmic adaptor subunit n=1 Tax=Pelagibius sp. Alg239-R121 TaxID=2993448 RepID=UPI0024A63AA3|nr:HlyD family efflux transporter periplasmic adaptor subunit [Pelagibius sp. Alg239-R121]
MSNLSRRVVIWSPAGLALAVGLAYAFWPKPLPVDLAQVERAPLVVTLDEEAETRIMDVFVLSAPIAGRALRIDLEVGDRVVAGETVVAQIEPVDPAFLDRRSEAEAEAAVETALAAQHLALAEVDKAEAEQDFSTTELSRARRLIKSGTITQRRLDDAERDFRTKSAAVETAKARLRMRDWELQQTRSRLLSPVQVRAEGGICECVAITAPVSGRILKILHESEGVVGAGEALAEIGDPQALEIEADFLSEDAVKIEAGQRVIIDAWGGAKPLTGRVQRVEPYGFTKISALGIEEQRVNVIIDLEDPPQDWSRLGHGYRVEVDVVLWENQEVLQVPSTAPFRNGVHWSVFALHEGRAALRKVTLGHRTGLAVQILDGLAEGESVVLHPSDQVVDGRRIILRE